jgi:hypothetical protein
VAEEEPIELTVEFLLTFLPTVMLNSMLLNNPMMFNVKISKPLD